MTIVKPSQAFKHFPSCVLAMGFGLGLMPVMPGSFGGLLAFPLLWALSFFPYWIGVAAVLLLCVLGIAICHHASRILETDDDGSIVWDEVCGAALAMLFVPASLFWWCAAYVMFRILDITKPWPVNWLDCRVGGGLGIMADDVAAGLMAGFIGAGAAYVWG